MTTAIEEIVEGARTEAAKKVACPSPGIYRNIPAANYHAWDAVSSSFLKKIIALSPAHARFDADSDDDDEVSNELIVGDGCHAALLQRDEFERRYAVGPDVKLNTKIGKDEWAQFVAANPEKVLIRGRDGPAILGVRDSIWAHEDARKMLENATDIELSIVWIDPETKLLCKARPDILCEKLRVMPDVKTTRSSKPDDFNRQAFQLAYHVQLRHYINGLAANGIQIEFTPIIAAEKCPPYATTVFQPDALWMDRGSFDWVRAMAITRQCMDQNFWPAYSMGVETLSLPAWAFKS